MFRLSACAHVWVKLFVSLFLLTACGRCLAQSTPPSPVLQHGVAWLTAQVQSDGTLSNEDVSIASPFQARAVSLHALSILANAPAVLGDVVATNSDSNTEYLARRIVAATEIQRSTTADIASLSALQNPDGGWGLAPGYASDPLDTAFALTALHAADAASSTSIANALGFLSQAKDADGGWGVNGQSTVYVSSKVLLATGAWSNHYSVAGLTSAASDWLLAQRNSAHTYASTFENALVLRALATRTAEAATLQPLVDALSAAQLDDGSWAHDPYVTALALGAIGFTSQPPIEPTTGSVQGRVVDQSSAAAIAGASVAIVGQSVSTSTSSDGSFALSALTAGSYTLRVTKLGYQSASVTIQITVGEVLNVGVLELVAAPLTASVSGVVSDKNGQPLENATVSVGTASALTHVDGTYQLVGLAPGPATITATLANYRTVSASVTFAAGYSYLFSPTLYRSNEMPPDTTLQGRVVDMATKAPIAGAEVVLGGVTQSTDSDGMFMFSQAQVGPFNLVVSAGGYQSLSASGSLVAGVNDVGDIALTLQPATSALSGVVTDADTNQPLADATVAVQGQGLTTTTGADGSYSIAGIVGTSFTLQASAVDYLSQSLSVILPQPGTNTLDIKLTKVGDTGISFAYVGMDQPSYAGNGVAELKVLIANANAQAASLVVAAQVFDAQNNVVFEFKANVRGLGENPPNLPVLVPANGGRALEMVHGMIRQADGHYRVRAQAMDASGRVVAEGETEFDVTAGAVLVGGVIPDPPLAQVGSQDPIHISADLSNAGNRTISAGDLDVRIVLQHANPNASDAVNTSVRTLLSGSPLDRAHGLVGDDTGNVYTVNDTGDQIIKVDAAGVASVLATLPQGVGAPALARDAQGNIWVGGSSSHTVFGVSPQGAVSSIQLSTLTSINGIDAAANGDLLFTGSHAGEQRLVRRDVQGQETVLWRNGLSKPEDLVSDGAGNYVVSNYQDNSLSKVSASTGAISAFAMGLNRPMGITRDAQGNFYVANSGNGTIAKVSSNGQVNTLVLGLDQPTDVAMDASGHLFVSNRGDNSIVEVLPDGTSQVFARGVANRPQGMKYDAAGNLWIANDDGTLRKIDTQGAVTVQASGLSSPRGLAINASDDVLVANYSSGTVSKLVGGVVTTFASDLSNPYGVAVADNGHVFVTERGANRISVLDATGNGIGAVTSLLDEPKQVQVGPTGNIYVNNRDSITVIENGVPRILIAGFSALHIAADPVHGGIVAATAYDVYHIADDGSKVKLNTSRLPFYNSYPIGVAADGSVLLNDYSNKRLQKLDASGNLSVYTSLPGYSQKLLTDLAGNVYVRLNSGEFYAIDAAGAATQIPVTLNEYMYGFGMSANGQILTWTSSRNVYAIDPITGAAALLMTDPGYTSGITMDALGDVYISDHSHEELRTYAAGGALVATLDGFQSPWDIVWTGSELRFVDSQNRFYSLTPGGYPVKLGKFQAWYLAVVEGEVYGSSNTSGIIHWNGTSSEAWTSVAGANFNGGIAVRADGTLSAADNASSRVMTFASDKSVISDFVGLVAPYGLAFDSQGRLHVANYGSRSIARFNGSSEPPSLLAKMSSPRHLAFDAAGNLWVSRSGGVDMVDAAGTVTTVSSALNVNGLLIDAGQVIAADGIHGQLLARNGERWDVFATGLSQPRGVDVAANGDIYVANHGNGTVAKYANGTRTVVASGLAGVNAVRYFADGNLYAGGDSGLLYRIAADGSKTNLDVARAVDRVSIDGIAQGTGDALLDVMAGGESIVEVRVSQAATPPAPGTVIYQTSVSMQAMPVASTYTHFELASWVPPYGGDFRIEVSRADVTGTASNFVHVGPAANGALSALEPSLPPGDQVEPMCLSLSGADFTSISRVETALVQPLVGSGAPSGMAADKAGNVYHTDTTTLYKTTPQGVTSEVASGLHFSFGLAADSTENLYAASRNPDTGHFDLLRFDASGQLTVVADLGVTSANGVQVDSHDNILVGSPGKLLKVTQQGQISLVTTHGLPSPRGIAIDGKDNVYVQNNGHYVSLIHPDGSVSDIFTRGDGIIDPSFEGDGYPNIAADCSDNFYIATSRWAKLGDGVQNGEEHTLAQVIPRTGQISLLFDARTIDPVLNDIDYLAYDRFGNRILMWNHYQAKIWQVPVTCGAISVEAHVVTPPGQSLTGITVPQSAIVSHADGSTEYVWNFRDVTTSGAEVCFDTTLHGLQLGETRSTLDSAFITFQNSFAANDVKQPLAIPDVHVHNLVNLNVATDKPDYPAQATAEITTTLANDNTVEIAGELEVTVVDADGVLVGEVSRRSVSVPANGTLPVTAPFAIGTIIPAQYTVTAVLSNNGVSLARNHTSFTVLPDNAAAAATSTVHTDKRTYQPSEHVLISSTATSLSSNLVLNNLTLMVKVYDAADTLQFSHGYPIAQLLPGSLRQYSVPQVLANAAPGVYMVKQELLDASNHAFNHVEATYEVSSSSTTGAGLVGSIAATPGTVQIGIAVALQASATNAGNADLNDLPLSIQIVDPVNSTVLQTFAQTSTLARDASVAFDASWATQGEAGATYFAVLSATVGSGASASTMVLAQDTFQLIAPTPVAAQILATGGTPQAATANTAYAEALQATVLDTAGNPMPDITVTFSAPTSGPSVVFPNGQTALTDANGHAAVAVTANAHVGDFSVEATATGVNGTATFALHNAAPPPTPVPLKPWVMALLAALLVLCGVGSVTLSRKRHEKAATGKPPHSLASWLRIHDVSTAKGNTDETH